MTVAWLEETPGLRYRLLAACLLVGVATGHADDWPMWRYDPQRSAASPNALPATFELIWQKQLGSRQQAWDDPLNWDLMTYDRVLKPIVMDGRLLVGFNDRDKLVALDADTGEELWAYYADAPVRLPPAGWKDRVYFCSDDGFLYCVDAASGKLRWRFCGAPSNQHAIGNRRLTSAWPARGGPVVRDDTVYFAASIWPFMGTFIYALDAETGDVKWINDSTGAQYIKQPHSAPSFAGVAPQGALVATENLLLVPGGRSVPAAFDRADGTLRYFEINAGGKGTGGSFVSANQKHFYVHTRGNGTRAFHLNNGVKTAFMPSQPVLDGDIVYSAESTDDQHRIRAYNVDQKVIWELQADGTGDLVLAGQHLVAAGHDAISIIQLPQHGMPARIVQSIPAGGTTRRLIVADRKLFAVTIEGQIMAFGIGRHQPGRARQEPLQKVAIAESSMQTISNLLATGDAQGYAFWYGSSAAPLAQALASQSPFQQLAVVDPRAEVVHRVRRQIDRAGQYGAVTIHHSQPGSFMAPRYVANMVFVDLETTTSADANLIAQLYASVRPYGGVMHLLTDEGQRQLAERIEALNLEQAQVDIGDHGVIVRRQGALPGSADWTHQYGDVANTIKSDDRRVKLPLGVLWFGGSSNMDVLPRHGHGPPEQVVGGRLFIEGINSLSARDVYTGRVLWKRQFDDLGTFDVYYDQTYDNTPLSTKYNQVHIPGANGRGTNFVVTSDRVYIAQRDVCHVLDPATGETLSKIRLPSGAQSQASNDNSSEGENWGYIGVYKDVLIGGLGFASYRRRHGLSFESDKRLRASKAGFGSKSLDRAASRALVGFDRYSGQVLWRIDADHSFWHNGIAAGGQQIYCLDRNPTQVEQALRRRGKSSSKAYRIVALDYRTGKPQWEVTDGIFGTWLSYSEEFDLVLQAGAAASDRLTAESDRGMAVYSAADGSLKWKNESLKYTGPCILHHDLIITNTNSYAESAGAFGLRDGKQKLVKNPITGHLQPWKLTRAYGCNNIIASENLLTFRSGAAGYYDLVTGAGTGNLGGFKSGCTSNLVVANGVLNAPDYTRTCSCAYQNQTSLALVHMPDVDSWTVNSAASRSWPGKRIERVGINFGAPGDRRDTNGLLWIEYPVIAGPSPPIPIEMNDQAQSFLQHSSSMAGTDIPWVLSSGVENVTDLRITLNLRDEYELKTGIPVVHADDDAEENERGQVNLNSSDLELVEDSGTQLIGMRFNNIQLPRDAEIRNAYIQFTCDELSIAPSSLIIAAEDTANATRFNNDSHDLSSRTLTQEEVGWTPDPWPIPGASAAAHRTPNLASIIQSVVHRPDWKPGNSIAILVSGSGKRVASAYRDGIGKSPRLVIDADSALPDADQATERYQLRLLFALPKLATAQQERVFDVYAQGQRVLEDLRLAPSGDGSEYSIEILQDVLVAKDLHLRFVPKQGKTVISGIELVRTTN